LQAFLAEKYIGHCKSFLSQAIRANGDNRWVRLVPNFVRDHNAQPVTNTNIARNTVNQHNYVGLLSELFKTDSPTLINNISSVEDYPDPLAPLVWKFDLGDKIMLSKQVDFMAKEKSAFSKVSVTGSYGPAVHTVTRRMAKNNSNFFISACYQISSYESVWWYEQELSRALFAEDKTVISERIARQKRERFLRLKRLRAKKQQQPRRKKNK